MAELINEKDSLNTGRKKLNEAIKDANTAKTTSGQADGKATEALANSESTQQQLDTIVIQGDSSVEAAQARVNADNSKTYNTLKERLDQEYEETKTQLAETEAHIEDISVNVNMFSDLKTAFETTVDSDLLFPSGTYIINTPISAALKGKRKWVASGKVTIKYEGLATGKMIDINLSGFDFEIFGDFTFDANNLARESLSIRNISATMGDAATLQMSNVKVINAYSSTVGYGSSGLFIQGGFNFIELNNCSATNISRLAGVGVAGSQGTKGISITHSGVNAYPQQVVINDPILENITSEELDGDANNLDCDGLSVFAPESSENPDIILDALLTVRGGRFKDCRGRSIKSQMPTNIIDSPVFIRRDIKAIQNSVEVDFQRGWGILRSYVCHYSCMEDGSSPLGASFKIVSASSNRIDASLEVKDGTIFNNLPTSYSIPYFITVSTSPFKEFFNVDISGNKFLGIGRVGSGLRGQLNRVRNVNIENNLFNELSGTLIDSMDSNGNTYHASRNVNGGSNPIPLSRASTGNAARVSGVGNKGFEERLSSTGSGLTAPEILRTDIIKAKSAVSGGSIGLEVKVIANGESEKFSVRGESAGVGLYLLSSAFNVNTQVVFAASSNSTKPLTVDDTTLIAFGNTASPDQPGKLNVWASTDGIWVKNMLGSSRGVTLASLT